MADRIAEAHQDPPLGRRKLFKAAAGLALLATPDSRRAYELNPGMTTEQIPELATLRDTLQSRLASEGSKFDYTDQIGQKIHEERLELVYRQESNSTVVGINAKQTTNNSKPEDARTTYTVVWYDGEISNGINEISLQENTLLNAVIATKPQGLDKLADEGLANFHAYGKLEPLTRDAITGILRILPQAQREDYTNPLVPRTNLPNNAK